MTEIRTAPHLKRPVSVETIMHHVVYSLLPLCAFAIYQFGLSAIKTVERFRSKQLHNQRVITVFLPPD